MSSPKVSICVPIYGVEKFIERCVNSLFRQTYGNLEFIFVDDCTPDNSINILLQLLDKYPNRKACTRIIRHEKNKGLAGARNTGVENSSGDFILWVDSDDYISTDCVEKLVELYKKTSADIVCFDYNVLYKDNRIVPVLKNRDYENGLELVKQMLLGFVPHNMWGHLIRRNLYIDNRIKAIEGINQGEDDQVMPRLAYFAEKVATLHEPLYFYDHSLSSSYSNNYSLKSSKQVFEVYSILMIFFKDKEPNLMDCLKCHIAKGCGENLRFLCQLNEDDGYFKKYFKLLRSINKHYWSRMTTSTRMVVSLRYKPLMRFYCKMVNFIKRKNV